MAIELSNLTFTEQDDIVPAFGGIKILNTGIANTLAGNDKITGIGDNYGFENLGVLNTDDGNDTIIGIRSEGRGSGISNIGTLNTGKGNDVITGYGYYTRTGYYDGIYNSGTLNTGEGNDIIHCSGDEDGITNEGTLNTEDGNDTISAYGQYNGIYNSGTLNTGEGNDVITANSILNFNGGTINTGSGEDSITCTGSFINSGQVFLGHGNDSIYVEYGSSGFGTENSNMIDTGDGDDIITSGDGTEIFNSGTINTDNGEDSIISQGNFTNRGVVFLGEGNDSIIAAYFSNYVLENFNAIETGDGDDIITTSSGVIYNEGVINTGRGNDSIIVDGGVEAPATEYDTEYDIYNNGGAINMGDGNDSIIAHGGFESGPNSSGAWFLGEGEDYIKGFGSGDFYGGNGNDTLELTPGTYTVGIWGEGGESPIFTKGNQLMITSEFEKLKAGGTTYDFASLTAGQIIVVA
ncbi:hypothetical protein [Microcoleus sp. herbarium2]|uniref:hypothetical protein n=1 Tax=Microcoleus sp. herbarium2 TaxID=3055433 RepID=UPI002FD06156